MAGDRLHAASDPLPVSTVPTWFNFDQSFKIPDPASTVPLDSTSFDLDFFNPPSLPSYPLSSIPGQSIPTLQAHVVLTLDYKELSIDTAATADDFSALFEIPQLDLLQPILPTFKSDWTEFLNFEPDLSLFPSSPSLASSSAGTPLLIDDAILSPSPLSDSNPSSPDPLLDILPHLIEKGTQFPNVGEPIIRGQDFLLPPGEDAGIRPASVLLSVR
jgi:hypothetical protein